MKNIEKSGIYIHVPFCLRKCPYCDFYSITASSEEMARYTAAVCRNLKAYGHGQAVDSVYFGGGTPSLLLPEHVAQILETVATCFVLSADTEVTLETNPATVTATDLQMLHKIGVNRLSIGVQSLEDTQLQRLGRLHTAQQAIATVEAAARCGFSNLSCDLMLAVPGQTPQTLEQTLYRLLTLPIQHVSAYLLKIEPETLFARTHVEAQCPDADAAADLYLQSVEILQQAGFFQYEISNFAQTGFASRHNCKYWTCTPYLGIGPSAHSCWENKRFFVPADLQNFLDMPVQSMELEDENPCTQAEKIMLGLRLSQGVPAVWLSGKETQLRRFCKAGFLRWENEQVAFTPKGFLVSNAILAELL